MSALSAFLAGLLAAWPAPAPRDAAEGDSRPPAPVSEDREEDPFAVWQQLASGFLPEAAAQVRIEQRIIWRIVPMRGATRENLAAIAPAPPARPKLAERRMGDCVAMNAIAGGQPQAGSRLLLFLRDRRLVAADLEKACSARDFYSGFYVDKPNADGKLCADRDRILARSGARCQISSFRLLVEDD